MSSMARRRGGESRIFFPWERRNRRVRLLSRRHAGIALAVTAVLMMAWVLMRVEARRRATHATHAVITNVQRAVEAYRADHDGRCPDTLAQLTNPGGAQEPYLSREPLDGWRRALRMRCPGRKHPESADVVSGGPSGTFEDTDQIE